MNEKRIDFPRYASIIICILGGIAAAYVIVRYLAFGLLPFLVSWGAAFALRPLTEHLHKKTRLSKKLVSFFLVLLALLLTFSILFIFADRLVGEIREFISRVSTDPSAMSRMTEKINHVILKTKDKIRILDVGDNGGIDISAYVSDLAEKAGESIAAKITGLLGKMALSLPRVVIFVLVSIISAFYFSTDLQSINKKILSSVPQRWQGVLVRVKAVVFDTALKYLRSYFIIMLITFAMLLIGFLIIGVEYYFLLSAVLALVDFLPVLGIGLALIPWGVILLATGDLYMGMGLLILYAAIMITRQIIEPRIIGDSLGIHPLLTLLAMYLGFTVFDIVGMILGPVVALVVKSLLTANQKYKGISVR